MPRNRITTELRADSAQLRGEFARAQKSAGAFKTEISAGAKALVGFAAGAIGIRAGLGIFTDLAEKFDRVGKLSNRFNLPVEDVQKLSVAAELTGTNIERLTAALTKSTVAGYEASQGVKTYSDAFDALGIGVDEFNAADSTQKVALLSRAFADAEDETTAFASAYRILGKAGSDLIPLLRENADGVERLTGNLATLGADDVAAIEAFNDEMTVLKANLQAEFAKAFAGEMVNIKEEIVDLGRGLLATTSFLIKHKDALKLLIGAWVAFKGIKVVGSLLPAVSAFIKSTLAIQAETAAVAQNTAAHLSNSGARNTAAINSGTAAAGKSKLGFVALAVAIGGAAYELGKFGGEIIAANLEFGEKLNEIDYSQGSTERAKELEIVQDLRAQAELENANIIYRNERMKETAKIQAEIAKKRAESRAELQAEINTLAAGVLETELSYKSQNEQLAAQREKMDDLIKRAREYAKINGLDATGTDTSAGFTDLAREAVGRGELEVAKQLLQVAERMQQKKAEILAIEEGIAATAKAKQTQERDLAASQQEALRQQSQELILLKLRAAGRTAEADALEKEIKLRQEARRIAEATGVSEENALKLARQKADLQLKVEGEDVAGKGLDNRFDADGNRKLARDGERKKIVLIRRDANGNRIDSRAVAAQRAQQKPKPEIPVSKIDRLIQISEDQLKTWGALQTSS